MRALLYSSCLLAIGLFGCEKDKTGVVDTGKVTVYAPVPVAKTNATKLLVHYMTWFEDKTSTPNHTWGQHWTMATQNPDNVDANGKRDIASYYYPLIGPYASGDKDVIEYHLLLMKYAGIDGVVIDWYGTFAVNDYASIKSNSEKVMAMADKVGLQYTVCYEDRTVDAVLTAKLADTKVMAAQADMRYLKSSWFGKSNYVKVNDKPLLLVFGPISMQTETEWTQTFGVLATKPCFLTLWNEKADAGSNASGEYGWVYQSNATLDNFYANRMATLDVAMGSAYPGFRDFYGAGGWGSSMNWTIDHNNGATLEQTLLKATEAKVKMLQLVTWNDFGEGTMIEPTQEFGYSYLNTVAAFAGFAPNVTVFDIIHRLFLLRKANVGKASVQKQLDQVFYYLVSLQTDKAQQLLGQLQQP